MAAGGTPGAAGVGEEWVEGDGMAIEVSGNGVGQDQLADVEARLQLLEHRMVQLQGEMREDMAALYRAGTLHGRLIAKLRAAVRVIQQLVERLYRMMRDKRGPWEPE